MKCSRCEGYMAIEPSNDFSDPAGRWQCINGGARKVRDALDPRKPIVRSPHTIPDRCSYHARSPYFL